MSGSNSDNPLLYATQSDSVPTTWAPSTWRPGQPVTPLTADRSQWPMPTQDQVEQQRQTLYANMTKAGWKNPQLSDTQVLSTMSNLPMGPGAKLAGSPQWFQDWANQNPQAFQATVSTGARAGVDMPFNQTYDPSNLKTGYASVGYANNPTIPREALVAHYGEAAVAEKERQQDAYDTAEMRRLSQLNTQSWQTMQAQEAQPGYTPSFFHVDAQGNKTVVAPPAGFQPGGAAPGGGVGAAGPAMYSTTSAPVAPGAMPTYGAQPYPAYASGAPGRNALASSSPAAANWVQQLQQQNPSFWDQLMRWIGLRQQQYGPGSADTGDGGFFAGGGGPHYTIGNVPAVPQARGMTYTTGS